MQHNQLFHIDAAVAARFPEIQVGMTVIRDVDVRAECPELEVLKQKVLAEVRNQLKGTPLASLPRVQAFRRIYRAFGVDPGSRRPSAEALLRRVLDPAKGGLYRINPVVDAYNLSSIEFQLPMAAYDLDCVAPPITLRFAQAGELHRAIGQAQPEPLAAGGLAYADQHTVLCRDFNYRDADATKVTTATRNLIVFVDGCGAVSATELGEALRVAAERIIAFNGGAIESFEVYQAQAL